MNLMKKAGALKYSGTKFLITNFNLFINNVISVYIASVYAKPSLERQIFCDTN